ncbi:ribonuclease H-like YkuK family protein [Natranaerobius thermophilus]|uniref:DUF458 domain-containing protein n=1 Tax=Natranaerobius thermophilus (strain ATCC BAA-1301 / DSM 18059 / JW/NM-WN-LF) TaxID=457570 RepID=B2A3M0_NATTJ|nr:ribonuclease H-like YkuK family protein [Natranaerobius thermophilus]ACB83646.1 protein of unknown function DUF458 [Natranaerobius thermophilus JW/NM-WN-LF]
MYRSPSRGELNLTEVYWDIVNYILDSSEEKYNLIIGTDSHNLQDQCCFVTAIIVHREGKGARYFFTKKQEDHITSLRHRIFYETSLSVEVAGELFKKLKDSSVKDNNLNLEIHLDIGEKGETKELIREVVGMVLGSGFSPKIKPESYGATKVADKYTK